MDRLRARGGWLWVAALVWALATPSCDGEGSGAGPTAGVDAGSGGASGGGGGSTSSSTTTSTSTIEGCAPEPIPDAIPDGWVEYTDWSCDCRFYVPGSKEVLPHAMEWEPCPDGGDGVVCRTQKVHWTDEVTPIAYDPWMDLDSDGKAVLGFARSNKTIGNVFLVAHADGPVHTALFWYIHGMNPNDLGCYVVLDSFHGGHWALSAEGSRTFGPIDDVQGAIGGPVDSVAPKLLAKREQPDNPYGEHWDIGESWKVRLTWPFVLKASQAGGSNEIDITSPATDPDGLLPEVAVVEQGVVFFETDSEKIAGINVWDPQHGARPFIRWPGDYTRGAANLGTDGKDMVWSYGEGKQPNANVYPVRSIMTAPFTTDPAEVKARRLRSQPQQSIRDRYWAVGCGYAAHHTDANDQVIVVRLSDGWMWRIPLVPERFLVRAIGITCDEVFTTGWVGSPGPGQYRIARVRLDSLGPGEPPD